MRSLIASNLSDINHVKPWKQAMKERAPDTAQWFEKESGFLEWISRVDSSVLWCSGKMGAGKTVLISNTIANLHNIFKPSYVICYFFCRSDQKETLKARNVLGSLARQLLKPQLERAPQELLTTLAAESQALEAEDVVDFISPFIPDDIRCFIIIDGVEECDIKNIRVLAKEFRKLCYKRAQGVKVLWASRPELEYELFRDHPPSSRLSLSYGRNQPDINQYVDCTLIRCLRDGKLKIGDPNLVLRIFQELRCKSCGM